MLEFVFDSRLLGKAFELQKGGESHQLIFNDFAGESKHKLLCHHSLMLLLFLLLFLF